MADFRYPQYCPLARAAEVVGERWTLLVLRELLLGPRRFSDLRRALTDVSTSVLADRLARLEERGLVAHRELDPPAGAAVYELSESGQALGPALLALARWGAVAWERCFWPATPSLAAWLPSRSSRVEPRSVFCAKPS